MRASTMKRGTELLREKLAKHGAQAAFVHQFNEGSPRLQVDAPMVSRWVGGRLPSPEHMARIEDLLEIPMRAWAEDADESSEPAA